MAHMLGNRLERLPYTLYPSLRKAALRLAAELATRDLGEPVSVGVWENMRAGRRPNLHLLQALQILSGLTFAELLKADIPFSAEEVERRLLIQENIWKTRERQGREIYGEDDLPPSFSPTTDTTRV